MKEVQHERLDLPHLRVRSGPAAVRVSSLKKDREYGGQPQSFRSFFYTPLSSVQKKGTGFLLFEEGAYLPRLRLRGGLMSARSVSIFVRRERGLFHATSVRAAAVSSVSATLAARACAAEHYAVPAAWIELLPVDEHVVIASVNRPKASVVAAVFRKVAEVFSIFRKGGAR